MLVAGVLSEAQQTKRALNLQLVTLTFVSSGTALVPVTGRDVTKRASRATQRGPAPVGDDLDLIAAPPLEDQSAPAA